MTDPLGVNPLRRLSWWVEPTAQRIDHIHLIEANGFVGWHAKRGTWT